MCLWLCPLILLSELSFEQLWKWINFALQFKLNCLILKSSLCCSVLRHLTTLFLETKSSWRQSRHVNDIMNIDQKPAQSQDKTKSCYFVWQKENLKQLKSTYWFFLSYQFTVRSMIHTWPWGMNRPNKSTPTEVHCTEYKSFTCCLCKVGCGDGVTTCHQKARWRN